jgi:hypothetical protein
VIYRDFGGTQNSFARALLDVTMAAAAAAADPDSPRSRFYRAKKEEENDTKSPVRKPAAAAAAASPAVGVKRSFNDGLGSSPAPKRHAPAAAAIVISDDDDAELQAMSAVWDSIVAPIDEKKHTSKPAAAPAAAAAAAPAAAAAAAAAAIVLNSKQQLVVKHFTEGRNCLMFGPAGVGKSEVYKAIARAARSAGINVQFLSSTVLSAYAIDGRTVHTFFGLDIHTRRREDYVSNAARRRDAFIEANRKPGAGARWYVTQGFDQVSRILRADALLLDEMFYLATSMFKTAIAVLKVVCDGIRELPLLIVTGDPMQGSPIPRQLSETPEDWHVDLAIEDREFVKDTDEWGDLKFEEVSLTHIYRQQDPAQKALLGQLRFSYLSESSFEMIQSMIVSADMLNARLDAECKAAAAGYIPPIYLNCRLLDVDLWNKRWLDALPGSEYTLTPHIYLVVNTQNGYYASALFDQNGTHEYSVSPSTKPRTPDEAVHRLFKEEIDRVRATLPSVATQCRIPIYSGGRNRYEARKNEAAAAILGKYKKGAPVFICHNQDGRPSPQPPVSNGTRGKIQSFAPGNGYPAQQPPARVTVGSETWLFTKFQPIDQKDYTSQFPMTIVRDDGLGTSEIGCVDRFFQLHPDDSPDWTKRRAQICVRGPPAHINFADTPQRLLGTQLKTGIVNVASAKSMPDGGGLLYKALSRFEDLKHVALLEWDDGAVKSELRAWEECRKHDPIASLFTEDDIDMHFNIFDPEDGLTQATVRLKKRFTNKRIAELEAAAAKVAASDK